MLNKVKQISIISLIISVLFIGCVSPEAVRTQVGGIETRLDKLEKVADNLDIKFTKMIQAETINYGGGGWIVLGASAIIVIFLTAFGLLIKMLLSKMNLLKLVTCAISKVPNNIGRTVKDKIEHEIELGELNGGPFKKKQKYELEKFTKKHGTFAKDS